MNNEAAYLGRQAERCRRLAGGIDDVTAKSTLLALAERYDAQAKAISDAQRPEINLYC